jgi:hypothetical protein
MSKSTIMKRGSFLKIGVAIGAFFSSGLNVFARGKVLDRESKGFKVEAGKDRFDKSLSIFDGDTAVRVADNFYVFLSIQKPNESLTKYVFELNAEGEIARYCDMK